MAYRQIYDGQPYWVVKDPLSLRYYRFNREEYFIIDQLREGVTLTQLKQAHRDEFKSDLLTNSEIAQFVSRLTSMNLLIMTHPNRDELLFRNAKKRRRALFKSRFTNFLFFKVPVYDPDKLFERMISHLRFIWTGTFFFFYLLLLALALGLLVDRWQDFVSMVNTSFFTIRNFPVLLAVIYLIKALHEFGHGLTCKNYNGEVHEMGWLFLVFNPFLYCNITDSWTFPSKAQRLLVTAAGMMTEILFAALAAIVWYFTDQPGFVHALAFNVVIACSVSTVLFNANPLLKFDGYYILMDLIEVPNLRQRSTDFLRNAFVKHVLGGRADQMPEEHRFRYVFPLYAVAAYIYRWFILFAILFVLYSLLENLRLVWLGRALVTFSAVTMIVYPLANSGARIARQRTALGISNVRLLTLLAVVTICLAGVIFWPLDQHVTLNFILEPAQMQWVRTEVDGTLTWEPHVSEGVWLESDALETSILGRLDNPELLLEEKQRSAEIQQAKLTVEQYRKSGLNAQAAQASERLETLTSDLTRIRTQLAALTVRTPLAGEVLSPDRLMKEVQGRYLPQGAPLLLIGDSSALVAKSWIPEKMLARVFRTFGQAGRQEDSLGQPAELMLYAFSDETFEGRIVSRSDHCEDNMGEFGDKMALSSKVGGEVLTEYDPATDREKPVEPAYEVTIKLDSWPESARPYMSGRARIYCGRSTLYRWGTESLLRFISLDFRL